MLRLRRGTLVGILCVGWGPCGGRSTAPDSPIEPPTDELSADRAPTALATSADTRECWSGWPPPACYADLARPELTAPPEATITASGLASIILVPGSGEAPTKAGRIRYHQTIWGEDGRLFTATRLLPSGQPQSVRVELLAPGWREGALLMVEGETRRLWIPGHLAYDGFDQMPQGTLVVDFELVEVLP